MHLHQVGYGSLAEHSVAAVKSKIFIFLITKKLDFDWKSINRRALVQGEKNFSIRILWY